MLQSSIMERKKSREIGSGTVGWGSGLEHGKFLKPGDVVDLEVEGVGVLRNRMGTPATAGWRPQRRTPMKPAV